MFQIMRITGDSMSPDYSHGDYVLLIKARRALAGLAPGDVVAFRQIAYGVMVKRVAEIEPQSGLVVVHGDNRQYSTDSRDFGPIHRSDIIGKVISHFQGR
jgi:nickel-type superoxide dismutase maturation protease